MQVFTCLLNSTMLGSLDLLLIDSYDTLNRDHARSNSRIWRNLFWKQKIMATLLCSTTTNAIYIHESSSMIPHSYLEHFEIVQTYCLTSVLCTFLTWAIHVHDINHCPSWLIIQKLIIPLKQKGKQVKWVIILMNPYSKKKGEERGRW